jgi:5-methylthioadenosine/S-adenosylhomocysteine deaminase
MTEVRPVVLHVRLPCADAARGRVEEVVRHYLPASESGAETTARTNTPLSFATHSEFRLGLAGDPRVTLVRMHKAGVLISLSFDASSIAPPNMFETMRFTWNMGIPWRGTPSENQSPVGFRDVIEMATINGARVLGLGDVTGSLTVGKRDDIIMIRGNDINVAPVTNVETAVVQSATPANVDTVMVDGKIVKRGGSLVAYDVEAIVERTKTSSSRIRAAAGGVITPRWWRSAAAERLFDSRAFRRPSRRRRAAGCRTADSG